MGGFAWVTLATNDSYSLGALVLAHSLKQVGTKQKLVVLVSPGVTNPMKQKLSSVFDVVQEVNILDSKDEANLHLLKRPELGVTFTKLHCWRLTQFDKCVFLDADTLVLQNCDELFEREELSAAPDVGWPDCFNSGVFVYKPSSDTYGKLVQFALEKGSFDGGDQGLLNMYFSEWATKDISKHLPFIYNMCSTACYSYLPAFKQFGADAKIIHFIGSSKPWLQYFNTETRRVQPTPELKHLELVLQRWWDIFCNLIHCSLTPDMAPSSSDVTHTNSSYSYHNDPRGTATPKPEIWDPWEEYDLKNSPIEFTQLPEQFPESEPLMQPIESHNTNACNASHHSTDIPEIPSFPRSPSPQIQPDILETRTVTEIENDPCPPPPPFVPPSECEAPASVCNETTLHIKPNEDNPSTAGIAGAFAQLTLGAPRTAEQSALDDHLRRQGWEVGNIDYLGRDSFDNIWSKICETLQTPVVDTSIEPEESKVTTAAASEAKPSEKTPEANEVVKQAEQSQPAGAKSEIPQTAEQASPLIEKTDPTATSSPQPQTPKPGEEMTAAPLAPTPEISKPAEAAPTTDNPKPTETAPVTATLKLVESYPILAKAPEVVAESFKSAEAAPQTSESSKVAEAVHQVCTIPHKAPEGPKPPEPTVCTIPAKAPEGPKTAASEVTKPTEAAPQLCPIPDKAPESPKSAESPVCPLQAKAPESPKRTEVTLCPIPAKAPESPKSAESELQIEAPKAPDAPKAAPESPKPQETPQTPTKKEPQTAEATNTAAHAVSPTPPPRKGSGGGKKAPKPKK